MNTQALSANPPSAHSVRLLGTLGAGSRVSFSLTLALLLLAIPARAAFHFWSINEIYSNPDGSVQFIEFSTGSGSQDQLGGRTITCVGPLGTHSFTCSSNLPSTATGGKTFVIGTANLRSVPGGVVPNYVFTNATPFLFFNAGVTNTVTLVGAITTPAAYTNLPTDGVLSLERTGTGSSFSTTVTNSPKNFGGQANSIVPLKFSSATLSGADILLSFATVAGTNYAVQTNDVLGTTNWATFTNVTGNGSIKTVAQPTSVASQRFYRLRVP